MAVVTLSRVPAAQAKPGPANSTHGFRAELQSALASAAPPTQEEAAVEASAGQARAGQATEALGVGHPDGFGGADLLTALATASPGAASAMASDPAASSGVQSFLPENHADASRPEAAQTFRPSGDVRTQDSVPAAAGNSTAGTAPGVPALPAPAAAAGAGVAGETEGPAAAVPPSGARQPGGQGGRASSTGAPVSAPAPVLAEGMAAGPALPAAHAQPGSATASIGPASVALPAPLAAPLFSVAGQQPAAAPAPASPAPSAPAPSPPLNTQLQGPLFSLASAKPGEHTMTLSVTPENLGPVTVRAQIGADGVRVDLFAANDAGREALRGILQDLKRDLASAGFGTDLDLSSQNQPDEPGDDAPHRRASAANQDDTTVRQSAGPGHQAGPYLRFAGSETGLDVLA